MNIYYLRLSKEDGDDESGTVEESCSIQSQRLCIRKFLDSNGFDSDSFAEFVDDGCSGTSMNRPGMNKLLTLVESGKVKTIVVRDLSRFARNYLEAGHYLEFVFPAYNVRFISINDGFDSKSLGETTGGLELAIRNLINQMYSKDISRKIKSSVDMKKLNGEFVYGTAPYGYKKGTLKNTIVIDEPAAIIVKQIFEWAASGIPVTKIALRLNESNIATPSQYLSKVRGNYKIKTTWSYESIRNILQNRIYTGDTVPFKSHVVRVGSDRVKPIPFDVLAQGMYHDGVETMFKLGILTIEDQEARVELGLEKAVFMIDDNQKRRLLTIAPLHDLKETCKKMNEQQILDLVYFAIENEIGNFDKAAFLKEITNIDIIKAIELNKAAKED